MTNQEKILLTGEPFKPSVEWALNIAMELTSRNGGSLDVAVMDVLDAINRLNAATAAPLEDLRR